MDSSEKLKYIQDILGRNANEHPNVYGVFWDFENITVPKTHTVDYFVTFLRSAMFKMHCKEVIFLVVCQEGILGPKTFDKLFELNTIVWTIPKSGHKEKADKCLLLAINIFARYHSPPAKIIIITGDQDFSFFLFDLNNRLGYEVILIHNRLAKMALRKSATVAYEFGDYFNVNPADVPLPIYVKLETTPDVKGQTQKIKEVVSQSNGIVVFKLNNTSFIKYTSVTLAENALLKFNSIIPGINTELTNEIGLAATENLDSGAQDKRQSKKMRIINEDIVHYSLENIMFEMSNISKCLRTMNNTVSDFKKYLKNIDSTKSPE